MTSNMPPKFLRSETRRHLRLGMKRRKLQFWRRPRGKHNKIRLKRVGYPVQPTIGFASPKATSGKLDGLLPVLVSNVKDVSKLDKKSIAIIARTLGAKKKIEIIKKLNEMNIKIANVGGKK